MFGNHVYISAGGAGLQVVDVGEPSLPSLVGAYDTPGIARDVVISGQFAYVIDGGRLSFCCGGGLGASGSGPY